MSSAIAHSEDLRVRLRSNVSSFEAVGADGEGLRAAAVALAIVGDEEGRACFLLTRRAAGLRRHAGQWALPGGRLDPEEEPVAAALRELREEVGLELDPGVVVGVLDDYPTRSGYRITPVVVWGPSRPALSPAEAEVVSVHLIPLDLLEAPEVPRLIPGVDPERPVIQIPLFGRFVHAPTAAILYQLREVGLHGRTTRVAHFDQPTFAWR
jgi:8-oxo-dGTP pyrophosphatase MutT (NUDIX family)